MTPISIRPKRWAAQALSKMIALVFCLVTLTACIVTWPTVTVAPPHELPAGAPAVQLFVYPDDDEQALLDRIAHAQQRVFMTMYLLTDTRVIDALRAAEKNGADVRAMVEENPFGGGSSARLAYERLKKAGINTKYANPTFRFTHEKSFVIDRAGVILTANMTKSAFSRNREFGIIHTDPADVAEMVTAFQADWNRAAFTPASPYLVWSPVNSRERIDGLINAASATLLVYAEVTQDDAQIRLLADAARRGVQVRLIVSPPSSSEDDNSGNAEGLDALQRSGVRVRQVKSPYIHAKVFVVDSARAFIGSENISTTSLEFNRELGIVVADPAAIRRLESTFEKDWAKAIDR